MITTSKSGIAKFINECVRNGMKHVVCSPGSRNAALIIAIDNHPEIETIVIHDERSAAFYALGMAQQLNAPVGVVCTSGSALLNYYPAVAEAYYQCIPLVVMSADRPAEWVNHGDGQTIVQTGVYGNHIRHELTISEEIESGALKLVEDQVREAFNFGNGAWKGPIHFNCPITEPMYGTVEVENFNSEEYASMSHDFDWSSALVEELKEAWNKSKRRMVLCGQMEKNVGLLRALSDFVSDGSLVILVENTSNLVHPKFVHCIDRTLSGIDENELENYKPDLLITLGGAVVSKRIKKFLRESPIQTHIRVGAAFPEMDTYRKLTHSLSCRPEELIRNIIEWNDTVHASDFGLRWKKTDYLNQDKLPDFFNACPYSDLQVFELLLDYLPEDSVLHMGNSSVVRYCQLFDPIASIRYYANRGTSGIDGSLSTACGAALIRGKKLHVMISGDVSFFYDSNALWSNHLPSNLRIVVINNSGGGIFRIIDGPSSSDQLEQYFETQQQFSAAKVCEAFNVEYLSSSSIEELESQIPYFLGTTDNKRPILMEIFTPNEENPQILKEFFKSFK